MRSKLNIVIVILFSLFVILIVQWYRIQEPFAVQEDFRTLFWLQINEDSDLYASFPFERIGVTVYEYQGLKIPIEDSSPGYSLIHYFGSTFTSVHLIHKLIPFPLIVIGSLYAYLIGTTLKNESSGIFLAIAFVVFNIASGSEISISSGLHRSFVCPILLGLIYHLLQRQFRIATIIVFCAGFIYMPIFPVVTITFIFSIISQREADRPLIQSLDWWALFYFSIAIIAVCFAVSPMLIDRLGPLFSPSESVSTSTSIHILEDPRFQQGGRRPLFKIFPILGRGGIASAGKDLINFIFLGIICLVILGVNNRTRQRLHPVIRNLFIASVIGWSLAWSSLLLLSSFLFYVPSRHIQTTIFLTLLIFIAINWEQFTNQIKIGIAKSGLKVNAHPQYDKIIGLTVAYVSLVILFIFLLFTLTINNEYFFMTDEEVAFLEFIETLPKDARIAGSPCYLDSVQYFGKRTVLFSCERFQYLENEAEVVLDMFNAYYAKEPQVLFEYCSTNALDFFVVHSADFTTESLDSGDYFFDPYNQQIGQTIQNQNRFAFQDLSQFETVFSDNDLSIIRCS